MPYALFLLIFLGIPGLVLGIVMRRRIDRRHVASLAILAGVALVYTTPWDNYLVASSVWWYDPTLVLGIKIGWVPIEEYTFFLVQPIVIGLWTILVSQAVASRSAAGVHTGIRIVSTALIAIAWISSLLALIYGWMPARYLALILVWALPPIALQTAFGADILWGEWRRIVFGLLPAQVYLIVADAYAIRSGTWTISPDQSLNVFLAGILPVEEFVFFLATNVLIVFSVILLLSTESHRRIAKMAGRPLGLAPLPDNG
jgi:lycopene cyclase domain-containing protein